MKLLLLHGPATQVSRRKLLQLREEYNLDDVVVFEKGSDVQTILGSLATPNLFSRQGLVILENPPENFTNYTLTPIPYVPIHREASSAYTLILWFDHEIDAKKWPGFEILFFPESKDISVFPFLDYLAARDKKAFLEIEKLKREDFDIFYFLTMAFYLLRNLTNTPNNVPQFVKDKLQKQRKNFSGEKIISLYKDLIEIDFKIKKGLLEKSQAEFMIINKFLN